MFDKNDLSGIVGKHLVNTWCTLMTMVGITKFT